MARKKVIREIDFKTTDGRTRRLVVSKVYGEPEYKVCVRAVDRFSGRTSHVICDLIGITPALLEAHVLYYPIFARASVQHVPVGPGRRLGKLARMVDERDNCEVEEADNGQ